MINLLNILKLQSKKHIYGQQKGEVLTKNQRLRQFIGLFFATMITMLAIKVFDRTIEIIFFYFVISSFVCFFLYAIIKMKKSQLKSKINEERYRVTLTYISEVLFDNVLEADITKDMLFGKKTLALTDLLGIPRNSSYSATIDAISRKRIRKDFSEEYRRVLSIENIMKKFENGEKTMEYECIERLDGVNYVWIRINICIFRSEITNTVRIISYVKNIQKQKKEMEKLMEEANIDRLTGLYNKASTREMIEKFLRQNTNATYAVMMLDIDNFKKINDNFGHVFGDEVIAKMAKRLKSLFKTTDIVGRIGGDEFLVFMPYVPDITIVQARATEILRSFESFIIDDVENYNVSFSIGIFMGHGGNNFNELYHYADLALYQAKKNGKNQFYFYEL
ncbi:MAG TPA: GGDEF domain-containing protein [Lachnospiraceae bacterium]|nr:GGDEF domain-containing protein [Lachnospiraceae bacterium]